MHQEVSASMSLEETKGVNTLLSGALNSHYTISITMFDFSMMVSLKNNIDIQY